MIDGRVQQLFVGCERLQRAHAGPGPDNRDQIPGLHLLIDKRFQRLSYARDALE